MFAMNAPSDSKEGEAKIHEIFLDKEILKEYGLVGGSTYEVRIIREGLKNNA